MGFPNDAKLLNPKDFQMNCAKKNQQFLLLSLQEHNLLAFFKTLILTHMRAYREVAYILGLGVVLVKY